MSRTNKLYNYLVNTYGLSKEMVLEYTDKRLDDLISKSVGMKLHSNRVERVIADQVAKVLNEGFQNGSFNRISIETYIQNTIATTIEQKLNDEYQLEVKIIRKSKQTIGNSDSKKDLK